MADTLDHALEICKLLKFSPRRDAIFNKIKQVITHCLASKLYCFKISHCAASNCDQGALDKLCAYEY